MARRVELDGAVKASFDDSGGTPGTYGSPRVWEDLAVDGWSVSVNTVASSMARQGLVESLHGSQGGSTRHTDSPRSLPQKG
ncbi:MAG: transposase [Actinomycetia bacterium]|nr:transposase [Actinomycetes bacterium]